MKIFFDTEFRTRGFETELISIGMVDENDNKFYAISNEFDFDLTWDDEWLKENVLIPMYKEHNDDDLLSLGLSDEENKILIKDIIDEYGFSIEEIKEGIIEYVTDPTPEFYAYYASTDFTMLYGIFGGMLEMPVNYPQHVMCLKQMMEHLDLSNDWKTKVCTDPIGNHNALVDAEWNKKLYGCIIRKIKKGE